MAATKQDWAGDSGWASAFRAGQRAIMEEVYRASFAAVRRAAGRVLHEPADRDAIVQEVFTDVVSSKRLRRSWNGGDLTAWLSSIARNRAIDFARREGRLVELDGERQRESCDERTRNDLRLELEQVAADLSDEHRTLIRLRFVEGMTQVEAAREMDRPRSTLEGWERELKERLRKRLLPGRGGER